MAGFFDWIRGQRGQPAPLGPTQADGPRAAGASPFGGNQGNVRQAGDKALEPWRSGWAASWQGWQRGQPAPFALADHRPLDTIEHRVPYGLPTYKWTLRFDRGSAAYAFDSGRLFNNPIGAGVVFSRQLPVFSPLIGEVIPGQGIFWNTQLVSRSGGPELGTLYSPQTLQALLGPTLGAAVAQQNSAAPLRNFAPLAVD